MRAPRSPSALPHDRPSKVLNTLSFVCPPLGLIVYLSLVGKLPDQGSSAGASAVRGAAAFGLLILFALIAVIADDELHLFHGPDVPQAPVMSVSPPVAPR